jgi:UDP-N-acetylglucosamine--N-acetylmuramyl-(pentapeptide) pyrophosphoryl-undecaprenol N-acetylglucosamine transferase
MPLVLAAADVAVTRAGASTVAELSAAGLPAVLVPLPGAPRDHQTANARELVDAGGAILLVDADCTADRLDQLLTPLIDSDDTRASMAERARSVGRPEAADRVADLLIRFGRLELS